MEKFEVITIGSSTRDVFIRVKEGSFKVQEDQDFVTDKAICFPLGSKVEISELTFAPGGGGVNAATTFARQGFKVADIGVVHKDSNGQAVIDHLKSEGIDTGFLMTHDGPDMTAYSTILITPDGARTILSYKGEGQNFDPNEIKWDEIDSDWLYVDSLGGNFEMFTKVIDMAKEKNIKVSMNPGGKELEHGLDKLKPYLGGINIFATNMEEAATLTGIDFTKEKEIFKFMDELIDGIYIMTQGPKGAVVSDGKNIYRIKATEGPAVERTGAGDSFNSGFAAGYIKSGGDIKEALKLGLVNAQSVVKYPGAIEGILRKEDTDALPTPEVSVELL